MKPIGFSTGALARADFDRALLELEEKPVNAIELSALRFPELRPLLESIPRLDLKRYRYVSIHAPSQFQGSEEEEAIEMLLHLAVPHWPIIVHPDSLHSFARWRVFGKRLAVENMDRRKPIGRTADELRQVFTELPDARLCFDIGHARQFDTTMTEAYKILRLFAERLCQIHVSEVNSASQHDRLSFSAILAFEQIEGLIPDQIPLIIESRVLEREIIQEIESVRRALDSAAEAASQPHMDDLTLELAALGYPGFAYLGGRSEKNPAEILLTALQRPDLEARVIEALPWLVYTYLDNLDWLIHSAKLSDLQNRLGFTIALGEQLAREMGEREKSEKLIRYISLLERSRLMREDTYCHDSMTEAEKNWLRKHRSPEAVHWNLLTDLTVEHLTHAQS